MAGKYDDLIGGGKLILSVEEILNEDSANKVDSQIKSQRKEWEEPIKITFDVKKAMGDLKKFETKIKNKMTPLDLPDIKEVLSLLSKLSAAGENLQGTFGNITASFSGVGLVSGLDDVLEKFKESSNALRNVDWGFGKLHDRNRLIEDQKIIIEQLKQIGRLRYAESHGNAGVDIFTSGFTDEDYESRFSPEELQTRLDLLQELRQNVLDYVKLTKTTKVTLFGDDIYQPNNFTYAIDSAIKGAQKQLEALKDFDVPNPEEILQKFYDHVDSVVDRRNVSTQLQSDIEYYAEAILSSKYTLEDAINDFSKDVKIDKLNAAWEEMIWDVDVPKRLLSMPEEYAAKIRNGSIELHDAISYMQEAINDAKEMSIQYDDGYYDGIGDLFEDTSVRNYNELVAECTQLTGELSDAVEKYTKVHREMMSVLDSGNNIPDELYEARDRIEEVISGYFKKDFFEPTLSTDGILMWLQSSEAAAESIASLVEDVENKYQRMLEAQSAHDSIAEAAEREREATVEILGIRKEIQRIESNASKYKNKDNYIKAELDYFSSALKSLNKQKAKLVDFKSLYGDMDFSEIIDEVHSAYKKAEKMLIGNITQRASSYIDNSKLISDVRSFHTLPKEQLDVINERAQSINEVERLFAEEVNTLGIKDLKDFFPHYDRIFKQLSQGAIDAKTAIESLRTELHKLFPERSGQYVTDGVAGITTISDAPAKELESVQDQVKAIEDAYEAATENVDRLNSQLQEAVKNQERLQKHAELYGYTTDMSAQKAGQVYHNIKNSKRGANIDFVINKFKSGEYKRIQELVNGDYWAVNGSGYGTQLNKSQYDFMRYLIYAIEQLNVGWAEGLEILRDQNGELKVADQLVESLNAQLERTREEKEVAYERLSYAHSGIIGDDAIAAKKQELAERSRRDSEQAQQKMQETAKLIGDLHSKYGDKFGDIFGSLKPLNTLNAEEIYDDLIAKEEAYITELQRRSFVIQEFMQTNQEIFATYQNVDGFNEKVGEISAAIFQTGLSAGEATSQLQEYVKTLEFVQMTAAQEPVLLQPEPVSPEARTPTAEELSSLGIQERVQRERELLGVAQHVSEEMIEQEKSASRVADAIESQGKAEKKVRKKKTQVEKGSKKKAEEESKQAVDFIQKSVDDALKQLREASDNKTALIDLTEVTSVGDLESRVKAMAQSIAGAYLKVDSVIVQDNIARIVLYNEQLGITASQMWRLQHATEDAEEAQLELISTLQKHSPRAAQKYSDAQQKKIDDANRWLISQMGVLDKQELSYKHSAKKVSGDTEIFNLDEKYFGKTLDELANEIRERITGAMDGALTQSVRNEITDALRVLKMEIQVAQAETYVKGRLSAQEVTEAWETFTYKLETFEQKAKNNNVFTQLEGDIKAMRKELEGVTEEDSSGLGRFVDKMRTAEAHFALEKEKESGAQQEIKRYEQLEKLQEKLYDDKKKLAKLEAEGKTDEKLARQVKEQEERYHASLNLLQGEKQIADILDREVELEKELKNIREQAASDFAASQQAEKDKQFMDRVRGFYTEWLKILKEINRLSSDSNALQIKDQGTGTYTKRIQDIGDLKSAQVAELRALEASINQTLSFDAASGKGGFVAFLDYCRENAILTTAEIEELNKALVKSEYIAEDFAIASASQQQEKQKKAWEEFLKLQKKYNEADYEWQKADIEGRDKTVYNNQMESYIQGMQQLRQETQFTKEQQIELDRVINDHNVKRQKLLENTAKAEEKYNQQVSDITSKVAAKMSEWESSHAFTRIFSDELIEEIYAFQYSLENLNKETNFTQLNKEWDKIVAKTKSATRANEEYTASAWKNRFQNEYMYNSMPSSYDDGEHYVYDNGKTRQDQGVLDQMADHYRQEAEKAEQEARAFNESVTSIYDRLMKATKEINSIDDKINKLTLKDGGTGLYAKSIQSLQDEKSLLVSDLRSINNEIKSALSFDDSVSNPIRAFFEDTRVQAILTSDEIEKFQNALKEMSDKGFGFKENLAAQVQPFVEKLQSLKEMIASGLIDKSSATAINALKVDSAFSQKWGEFAKSPDAANASEILKLVKAYEEYINRVEKAASKEAEYFAAKKQYANISTMQDYNDMASNMDKMSDSTNRARQDLEKFVAGFTDGKGIITGFTTSADGISKINFSVLEEGTGYLRSFSAEMGQFTNNVYTMETSMGNMTAGTTAAEKALSSMSQVMSRLNSYGMTSDNNEYVGDLYTKMQTLSSKLKELGTSKDMGDQNTLKNMAIEAERLLKKITALEQAYLKMNDAVADGNAQKVGNIATGEDPYEKMVQFAKETAAAMPGATLEVGKFNEKTNQLPYVIETADGEVKTFIMTMDKLGGVVTSEVVTVEKAKTVWQQFGASFGGLGKAIEGYAKRMLSVWSVVRYLRQGFKEVLEIDTAMTELKKVTDETSVAYKNFLDSAYVSAKKLGSTMKEFTQATADFARLGYSLEDASMLAEAANVYMNVGDGIEDVGAASESIISTMKAFNIEAEDSMGIVDRFNEVGNNFAIDSVGIGEALQRSASALAEAGNTIDESIALVTGANTVVYFVPRYYSNIIASR